MNICYLVSHFNITLNFYVKLYIGACSIHKPQRLTLCISVNSINEKDAKAIIEETKTKKDTNKKQTKEKKTQANKQISDVQGTGLSGIFIYTLLYTHRSLLSFIRLSVQSFCI